MARKRPGRRPGSVRWREERQSYEARVTLPDRRRPSAYFEKEKDAWAWINRMLADAARGRVVVDTNQKTGEYLGTWLENVASRTLKPNSLYNYRLCIGYVTPHIGRIKLKDLKRQHIEACFKKLDGRLSRHTLQLTHRVLKQALEVAMDDDLIPKNPMHRMKAPRLQGGEKQPMTIEDCRQLMLAAEGTRWHAAIWLLSTTGMRISECMGLRWSAIDLDKGEIRLEKQTQRYYGQPGVHLVDLKTESSRRTVKVPPITGAILRRHRQVQRFEQKKAGVDWRGQNTVFCNPMGGLYFRSEFCDAFRRFCREAGVENATPHTFRHTVTTILQEQRESLRAVQGLLGHSTERMTLKHYSHPTDESLDRIAATMQELFGDAVSEDAMEVDAMEE